MYRYMGIIPFPNADRLYYWAEPIVFTCLMPSVSWLGHLAGIIAGILYVMGPLQLVTQLPAMAGVHMGPRPRRYDDEVGTVGGGTISQRAEAPGEDNRTLARTARGTAHDESSSMPSFDPEATRQARLRRLEKKKAALQHGLVCFLASRTTLALPRLLAFVTWLAVVSFFFRHLTPSSITLIDPFCAAVLGNPRCTPPPSTTLPRRRHIL